MNLRSAKKIKHPTSSHTLARRVYIRSIGWNRQVSFCSNQEVCEKTAHRAETIEELTGIRTRSRWMGDPIDLAMGAIVDLSKKAGPELLSRIDLIIVSASAPVLPLPQTAALISQGLGALGRGVPVFDLQASCSGYIYALTVAHSMIHSGGYGNILIVTLEKKSRQLCPIHGPETAILFGDMATATLVSGVTGPLRMEGSHIGAKGELASMIYREPDPCNGAPILRMDGGRVYREAIRTLGKEIPPFLENLGTPIPEIDLFVFHQANGRLIDSLGKRLGLDREKVPLSLDSFGNTSSSSIPLTLALHLEKGGEIPRKVLLGAFGGGATFGLALLTRNQLH
ncbi:ketoacyl-ACP synthase III [Leptospirillum ferrooxidans]|jgi:3-oxoacyl-[acyl-carrier-protein] synthase-3|uniref:Putative 3-oxoacyl-[acyl-carrier-protein] synthase 3 n=1 Tax=Leptospirillum ferrooxidans (strain C2-3) TaxID=1162668 RepID=I0IKG8_LEPFC|nr:ketoacyl-ACP synthase III [Leptospirillum ferrooxidans]BAM05767.1 putative 3-oxoacyl-[acyl-carrier-protein] synthase 3 [Leptospirillum ferrooxidans C2-3]